MPLAHCSEEARPYTVRYSSYWNLNMILMIHCLTNACIQRFQFVQAFHCADGSQAILAFNSNKISLLLQSQRCAQCNCYFYLLMTG